MVSKTPSVLRASATKLRSIDNTRALFLMWEGCGRQMECLSQAAFWGQERRVRPSVHDSCPSNHLPPVKLSMNSSSSVIAADVWCWPTSISSRNYYNTTVRCIVITCFVTYKTSAQRWSARETRAPTLKVKNSHWPRCLRRRPLAISVPAITGNLNIALRST